MTAAGGESSWATANSSVDLPQPDSPTMPTNSPGRDVNDTSSTARTGLAPVSVLDGQAGYLKHERASGSAGGQASAARRPRTGRSAGLPISSNA